MQLNKNWEFVHNSFVILFLFLTRFHFENNSRSKASEEI